IQKLLPHKYSEDGPAMAVGDIDGNGTDDLVCGGSSFNSARIFLQLGDGKFVEREVPYDGKPNEKNHDDAGILLFDAENDGDIDMYIASGGYENDTNSSEYADHLYVNDGQGNFTELKGALPLNYTSKSCVRSADFDRDGDPDLLIAGRVDPWHYPRPVSCSLLRNDSEGGRIKFTDVTQQVAGELINIGIVSDAVFTDFNNDGWPDLVLAGEWLPPTFLLNDSGVYRNITASSGLAGFKGWWSSVLPGDFDNDGDIDYILGNLGLNTWYRATPSRPLSVYGADFDKNGSYDAFPAIYLSSSQKDTSFRKYPLFGRDDAVRQMISLRSKFQNYKSFATATINNLFSEEQLSSSLVLEAGWLKSSLCRNDGNNRFTLVPLPAQAQLSVLKGMVADDFDQDGNVDVIVNGNDFGTEVFTGRYDALNGLVLKGKGEGTFIPLPVSQAGIYIPGNGRSLVKLRGADGSYLVAASQNRGQLKIFRLNKKVSLIPLFAGDQSVITELGNGKSRRDELFSGTSYLSQSGKFLMTGKSTSRTLISNSSGRVRVIE
ncbi:MAG TPA: VCBS repeat-containing protein, partial [Bacteroidales bacterium]|nr:VCBS repeat-containing protein [Bacteroidales bacterium]